MKEIIIDNKKYFAFSKEEMEKYNEHWNNFYIHKNEEQNNKPKYPLYKTIDENFVTDLEQELYGVCTKANWETKILKLKYILKANNPIDGSYKEDTWLFFAKEENRNKYIEENRPNYSLNNIKQAVIDIYGENKLNLNNFLNKVKIYKNLK